MAAAALVLRRLAPPDPEVETQNRLKKPNNFSLGGVTSFSTDVKCKPGTTTALLVVPVVDDGLWTGYRRPGGCTKGWVERLGGHQSASRIRCHCGPEEQ